MKEIKQKSIELLLNILPKDAFEMMLYKKVETEDLLKNELLFDLVNINYRLDNYKDLILKTLDKPKDKRVHLIYKVNLYCQKIIKSDIDSDKIKWFEKALDLFCYDDDYDLIWNFIELSDRLGFLYMKYESQKNILDDICFLSSELVTTLREASTVEEKYAVLANGIPINYKVDKKWYEFWK
ncbi:hypothetical protein [Polaribacter sp.]|uniref:hypothetical protein n=1 Tax=Polaribacter sp. TaxID=1920175 RepID=UPI003F6B230B